MKTSNYRTSVPVFSGTRDRLVGVGKKNESYDRLLNRLMDHYYNFTINGTGSGSKTFSVVAGTKGKNKK